MARDLRVLIDARMLMGRFSGVARMATSLVDHLTGVHGLRVVALCGNEVYEPWRDRSDMETLVTDFSRSDRAPARRLWWEGTRLRNWIQQARADVYHATWNSGIPWNCPVPAVLTVHDLIPWEEPARNLSARFSRWCYRRAVRSSIRNANRIATVSGFTTQEITQKLSTDPARIRIIYNGVQIPSTCHRHVTKADPPYVLYVGGHEPRKNVQGVLRALQQYWTRHDAALELHLTGTTAQLDSVARDAYEGLTNQERVRFLGSSTDDQLAEEYARATALLFLSRAEGFGLPALEAMAHGCPVIAARCGALPEIVGNAGLLVNPDDLFEISNAIERARKSPEALVASGLERAAAFSWQRAAEAYHHEYALAAETRRTVNEVETIVLGVGSRTYAQA